MKTTKIKVDVNVSSKITNYENTYGRDNTPQAKMSYFHHGPSEKRRKCT